MSRIQYINDKTGTFQEAQGSDGHLNVSARADTRSYYNSRNEGQTYSLTWDNTNTSSGETVVHWKNISTSKTLVISSSNR